MIILGINSAYHESSAALIRDGALIAAVEEERFTRVKHGKRARVDNAHLLPIESIEYCLAEAGIKFHDIDYIGFSFNPEKRLKNNVGADPYYEPGSWGSTEGERLFYSLLRSIPEKLEALYETSLGDRFHWIDHHVCHACSAYYVSPFSDAAVLSVDGIGEYETAWLGKATGNKLSHITSQVYPDSLGFLWERISTHLGFDEYGVWKVMGMHSFGDPKHYYEYLRTIVKVDEDGFVHIDNHATQFRKQMAPALDKILGPSRKPSDPIEQRHMDIAAALQQITNETILAYAHYLKRATGSDNICMAGGVALNCVANGKLQQSKIFKNIFIQPSAHDAGTAIGAAYYIWHVVLDKKERHVMEHAFWGPQFNDTHVMKVLEFNKLSYEYVEDIADRAAQLIADGNIVAWFQGRMEFGPRALGNRSILADPRKKFLVDIINAKVKHREYFRPFAPSVLQERYHEWFEGDSRSIPAQHMLYAVGVNDEK